jgi:N-hydroxyarylamine O-acetyltransferase
MYDQKMVKSITITYKEEISYMSEINQLFRKKIGFSESEIITFEKLEQILEKTSRMIPFENTNIIFGKPYKISKESLTEKILIRNEGGLCYELNPIFYFFLLENEFNVRLVRGVVYNQPAQRWSPTGRTHAAVILYHEGKDFLIDTGFGANMPLKPVPLDGDPVVSNHGEFRVTPSASEHGNYLFHVKLRYKDADWRIGYCFDTKQPVKDITELDEIQSTISKHPGSGFNKHPLITRFTNNGNITLTDTSFTQSMRGEVKKEAVDQKTFKEMAKNHFSITI